MKQQMIVIVTRMVTEGYWLANETVEQFVDRIMSYGVTPDELLGWERRHLGLKG